MDRVPLTSSADRFVTTPNAAFLRTRIQKLEAVKQTIGEKLAEARTLLIPFVLQEQEEEARERIMNPHTIEDLLLDPSYENDRTFEPSQADELRLASYKQRQGDMWKTRENAVPTSLQTDIAIMTGMLEDHPNTITEAETRIEEIEEENGRGLRMRIANWWSGEKKSLEKRLAILRHQLSAAETKLPKSIARLENAEEMRRQYETIEKNKAYDPSLQDQTESLFLQRSNQAVLVSYDPENRDGIFTLHLPRTPEDKDFTVTASFRLESNDDEEEFAELLGIDVGVYTSVFPTVGKSVDYQYDFQEELIPFGLEIVEVNNELRFRLPQAVWNRFGSTLA
jgi:hypothetical protein